MSQMLYALFTSAHALATAVFVGYYLLLSGILVPVLAQSGNGAALSDISKRSRPWLYTSLIVFFVTGGWLMFTDPEYLGLMHFGSAWTILMLVKHILILAIIVMGFWFNAIQRVGPLLKSNTGAEQAIARYRSYSNAMAIMGVLVLLLTALAQAA